MDPHSQPRESASAEAMQFRQRLAVPTAPAPQRPPARTYLCLHDPFDVTPQPEECKGRVDDRTGVAHKSSNRMRDSAPLGS
jgi:hypothetical protein